MGLLDDAIREHLDLKRRRGADPAEIERSEREALGPVRRAPEELESAEFDAQVGAGEAEEYEYEAEYEDGHEHEAGYEESHETQLYEAEPPEYEPPGHEPLANEPLGHESLAHESEPPAYDETRSDHEPLPEDEPFAETPPAHEPPTPHAAPESGHLNQETVEYELQDHPEGGEHHEGEHPLEAEHAESGEHPEGEDVLEETPEFLQDTPEHDRLWFEQRPPRDFDFDG